MIFPLASESSKKLSFSTVNMIRQAGQSSVRYETCACMKPLKEIQIQAHYKIS